MDHDQNFKNLILDYPRESLEFFAGVRELGGTAITPVREEQLKEHLGSRYRKLDVPLKVEWPDGRREAVVFVVEEETEPRKFSIHRLAHYCLDIAEMLGTERRVPVVVFLHADEFPQELRLCDDDGGAYLSFRFLHCMLGGLNAEDHLDSGNIVARVNLPNMAHARERRLEIYHHAVQGLERLEPDLRKQRKYADFIDAYADLSEGEVARYRAEYCADTGEKAMGLAAVLREEGRQEGRQEGLIEGERKGEAALLLRLMALKFGPVSASVEERIRQADAATLLGWGGRGLTASAPDDVVGD